MARLGDLFLHIRNGANIKQGLDNTGYPITRIETISNRTVDRNKMGYAGITDLEKYSDFVMQDGDILMSHINSETHLGKTALYEKEGDEIIIHGMNLLSLRPNKDLITSKYAFYYLSSQSFLRQIPNITKKSVNQASFTVSALKELVFPLMSIEKQKKITVDLDKVNDLISLRKQQLSKLDELVKSRFVELFGERLEKETVKLSTLTEVITKGTTPTTLGFEFTESGVNFVKIECITEDGKFIVPKMLHISDACNQKLKRSILQEGDVLFSIAGAIGRTAIVTKEILPANTNQAVAIIRLQKDCGLNVKFLNQMLHSSLIEKQVNVKKAGVAQINLSLTDIGDFNIVVPPMEEQEQFAAFVEQTDKSKSAIQQSLDKLETLKKALMQKYFG